jgi:hypothetical protein
MSLLLDEAGVVGSAQTGITPFDLDNQKLFLDFRDADSYTESGGKVTDLNDLYNLSDFAQSNTASQATISDGKLVFTGNKFYSGNPFYFDFLHNGSDWTIFLSIESKQDNSSGTLLTNNGFSSPVGFGLLLDDRSSNSRDQQIRPRIVGTSGTIVNTGVNNTLTLNTLVNACITYDFTNSVAGGKAGDIFKDGVDFSDYNNINKNTSTATNSNSMRLGQDAGGGGLIAEIRGMVITQDVWTPEEVTGITSYFS